MVNFINWYGLLSGQSSDKTYVYFERDKDMFEALELDEPKCAGFLLPDERMRVKFQEQFYLKDNLVWGQECLLDVEKWETVKNKEYDICFYVNRNNLDYYYWLLTKMPIYKYLSICEETHSFNFMKGLTRRNLTVKFLSQDSIYDQAKSNFLYELPSESRIPPLRVGISLCQDVALICQCPQSFDFGDRTFSLWDRVLTWATGYYKDKYKTSRDLSYIMSVPRENLNWIKPRQYYITHLGSKNFLQWANYEI